MNRTVHIFLSLCTLLLISCEGRTGYYDSDQQETIARLTAKEWKLVHEDNPNFPPTDYEEEGWVYKFNSNGTGSYKWINHDDGTNNGDPVYFRWTFTTENFAVIYIDKSEQFWLIDKLTAQELWVYTAFQDPVLYPNTDKRFWKFMGTKPMNADM